MSFLRDRLISAYNSGCGVRLLYSDQSLVDYSREYRSFHGLLGPKAESKSTISRKEQTRYDYDAKKTVDYKDDTVKVGPANLKFHRTLRVPDNVKNYMLPPYFQRPSRCRVS